MKIPALIVLAAFSLGTTFQASSGEVRYFSLSKAPSPLLVAKTLVGQSFTPKLKMRGVRQVGESAGGQDPVAAEGSFTLDTTNTLAMPIPFAFNSSALTTDAVAPLDQIAEGVKLVQDSTGVVIVIEGHTDAVGSAQYNKRLSMRRAAAVKKYLVATHGINASLLKAVGKGQSEPLNPENPRADENRRVQFRAG